MNNNCPSKQDVCILHWKAHFESYALFWTSLGGSILDIREVGKFQLLILLYCLLLIACTDFGGRYVRRSAWIRKIRKLKIKFNKENYENCVLGSLPTPGYSG